MIEWTILVVFLIVPFVLMIHPLKAATIDRVINTHSLDNAVLYHRIFYSPNSIFYRDLYKERVDLGVVDMSRFNDDTLEALYAGQEKRLFAIRIEIELDGERKEIFFNKRYYDYVSARVGGIQNSKYGAINGKIPVKIKTKDGDKRGYLTATEVFLREE